MEAGATATGSRNPWGSPLGPKPELGTLQGQAAVPQGRRPNPDLQHSQFPALGNGEGRGKLVQDGPGALITSALRAREGGGSGASGHRSARGGVKEAAGTWARGWQLQQ